MKEPAVARMAEYKLCIPDEMEDVADWKKEAARKIPQLSESVRAKISKIFQINPEDRMIYICVELISGKEDIFTFYSLANAVENAHMLNRLEPRERWVVMPRVPWGAYTKISQIRLSAGRE